jgi:anti-sigma factor (TIGR02949 family)
MTMDCDIARAQLEAYLDNELARADARELEAHVDGCAACSAALGRLDDLRRALREPSLRHTAPPGLRERIAASAAAADRSQLHGRHWLRMAAAWLLAFGAGGASVYLWNTQHDSRAQLAHDAFAGHWRALAAASPVDVVSSDRHTVKPWFAGKIAQAPAVQDFADQGFPLVGGRLDYLGDARVPALVYRHGQHLIDVFLLPAATIVQPVRQHGYALEPVLLGGQPAVVVSDMDAQEMQRFTELLKNAR